MGAVLFDIKPLRDALAGGRLILTANNRQRNQILRAYHTQQADVGLTQWPQPRLYTLNQWIDEQWQHLILEGAARPACLISNWQSRLIWERAIEQSDAAQGLLRPRQLAPTAETARATLTGWQCPTAELESYRAFESEADANAVFADWLERFDKELAARDLVTRETAQGELTAAFAQGQLPPETGALVYGFNQLSPLAEALLNTALPDAHWLERVERQPQKLCRTSADNAESELAAAANWASRILERQSDAVVGIVVPELGQRREQVERLFCEVFEPRLADPLQPRYTPAFNFSAGTPLGSAPIIASALELIDLHRAPLELERVCNLMASPFWGDSHNESLLRSRICVQLRDMGKTHISGADLRYAAQRAADKLDDDTNDLHRRLERAGELQRERHQQAPLSQWFDRLFELLETLGWPGSRRLDSVEYQQLKQWYELQAELAAVDPVRGHFGLSEALQLLRQSAEQTHFQPQTPDSPIQILGALEAAGLHFTHLWVVGLHHRAWPAAPRPNPLLPIPLQREWRMPHASPDRELNFAERLTAGFRHSAFEVVFSHPSGDADEPLKASALIESVPYQPLSALTGEQQSLTAQHHHQIAQSARLEKVSADRGPGIDTPAVRGGASLFKHQAACPFGAFARHRLGARAADRPALGFSAIERGNALHGVLASLWRELQNSDGLAQCSADALRERIERYCREEITPLRQRRPRELSPAYAELEIERLTDLIGRWLSFERERRPFEVEAVEKRYPITYAGLKLNLQVDRMDRLADGGLLVIDYKTGQADPRQWRSEALKEPQLPLYACAVAGDPTRAIAFGLVNAERQTLAGWGTTEDEGLKTLAGEDWEQQIEQWHEALTALAEEFRSGWALAEYRFSDARRLDKDLHPLSRIAEQPRLQAWRDQSDATEPDS